MKEAEIELGRRAATAFKDLFPDAWEHNRDYLHCTKCGAKFEDINDYSESGNAIYVYKSGPIECTVPTPIDINWDNAMKLVRECDYMDVWHPLADIKLKDKSSNGICIAEWITHKATPADYIEAAIIAKEAQNGRT